MRAGAIGTTVKPGNVCCHELSLTCSECRWAAHDCFLDVKPMAESLWINRVNVLDQGIGRHRRHERHGQTYRFFRRVQITSADPPKAVPLALCMQKITAG